MGTGRSREPRPLGSGVASFLWFPTPAALRHWPIVSRRLSLVKGGKRLVPSSDSVERSCDDSASHLVKTGIPNPFSRSAFRAPTPGRGAPTTCANGVLYRIHEGRGPRATNQSSHGLDSVHAKPESLCCGPQLFIVSRELEIQSAVTRQ